MRRLLSVDGLHVRYGQSPDALRAVDLTVREREVVAVLGRNGSGKTTLLRAITNLLGMHSGRVTDGEIRIGDKPVTKLTTPQLVAEGVTQVMEGRRVFKRLTVLENLQTGASVIGDAHLRRTHSQRVFELFPVLAERQNQRAGLLSGGEQQMLAIGRALMAGPTLIVMDEPSLGLSPGMVREVRDIIATIHEQGTAVLLVEQNARMAMSVASRVYVLEEGAVATSGSAQDLAEDASVQRHYLGMVPGLDSTDQENGSKGSARSPHGA